MGWIISGIFIICIIILIVALRRKQIIDRSEFNNYTQQVKLLEHRKESLNNDIAFCEKQIAREQQYFEQKQAEHTKAVDQQARELDAMYERNKSRRMEQLENEMLAQEDKSRELLQKNLAEEKANYTKLIQDLNTSWIEISTDCSSRIEQLKKDTEFQETRFQSLLAPLQQYERDQQAKLYYTIQVPEEYHSDIDYLLTTVAQKVNHPDIISKLVWAEYVKPYMDETIKRVEIKDEPGIYKITNITTGKCYIGKSTIVKKRLQDHMKSSVGIQSIADQAVHHAILEEGLWNWSLEIITYCDKDKLNELEKYYIEFFKSVEYGYNKNSGGGG